MSANDKNLDSNTVHNTAMIAADLLDYESDTLSIASTPLQRTPRPSTNGDAKCSAAARAQLSRDMKAAAHWRALGRELPTHLAYVDTSIHERRQKAKEKVDARRSKQDTTDAGAPLAVHAGAHNADNTTVNSEVTNETSRVATRAPRPHRIVPVVAAGVHMRQVQKVRSQYTTPVTDTAVNLKTRGGKILICGIIVFHVCSLSNAQMKVAMCSSLPAYQGRPTCSPTVFQ